MRDMNNRKPIAFVQFVF